MGIAALTHKPGKPGLRAQEFREALDFWSKIFVIVSHPQTYRLIIHSLRPLPIIDRYVHLCHHNQVF